MNCCAEVRDLLGCPGDGACRGIEGNCADLPAVFAAVPVLPHYPDGLGDDYACAAFPNDDRALDSFIVALISLAIALPVTQFIAGCFSVANDNEAPESWLSFAGLMRLLLGGSSAVRRWQYTKDKQPSHFVRWYARSGGAPLWETGAYMLRRLHAWATCTRPYWLRDADHAAARVADDVGDGRVRLERIPHPLAHGAAAKAHAEHDVDDDSHADDAHHSPSAAAKLRRL